MAVPDEKTAVSIAKAIWLPVYGEEVLKKKPFKAKLLNGVWIVTGSLPKDTLGGVPIAEISKSDGRVNRMSHGK